MAKYLLNGDLPEMHKKLPKGVKSECIKGGSYNCTGRYSFCGPYTKFKQRACEGYEGVNDLDKICKSHDQGYCFVADKDQRRKIDIALARQCEYVARDDTQEMYVRKDAKSVADVLKKKPRHFF
ncbi:UNVERIFIED_CONTAM: hypothetical protein RMT77_003551 [Armadillidium vulgare]